MNYSNKSVKNNKNLIHAMLKGTERAGIEKLLDWLDDSDYYTAPASTRLDFHGCEEGGLASHSLNVYELFSEKVKKYEFNLSESEVMIASLMHDACKIDLYKPNILKSGKLSTAKPYIRRDDFPFGHGEKSVFLVSKHIDLTPKESLLMRWHMGNFDSEWEHYEHSVEKACPEVYAFQYADQEASKYMDYKK